MFSSGRRQQHADNEGANEIHQEDDQPQQRYCGVRCDGDHRGIVATSVQTSRLRFAATTPRCLLRHYRQCAVPPDPGGKICDYVLSS